VGRTLVAVVGYHLSQGRINRWETGGFAVPEPYIEALDRAGGTPAILSPGTGDVAAARDHLLERFDALVLVGGGDVDPGRYGQDPHPSLYGMDPERDDMEFELLVAADRMGVPTLTICRGAQVMNVAFGGSLLQHLPDVPGLVPHGIPGGGSAAAHDVNVAESSRLFSAAGRTVLACSSHHHQGLDRLGDGITVVAWSGDGLVEAIERDHGWMLGVQWHPEDSADTDPGQQALVDALVEQARA
jgi:putative glutamine amidotransferase